MSFVKTYIRRAAESLRPYSQALPSGVGASTRFKSEDDDLFILGISEGIGTCADIHGMDILVLGYSPNGRQQNLSDERVAKCKYAVLLRAPTDEEAQKWHNHDSALLCVELLEVTKFEGELMLMSRTGNSRVYSNSF